MSDSKMWQCTKCGRKFKKTNQDHFCGTPPKTIEEYIECQPENIQPLLLQLHHTIQSAIPDSIEKISWSMPTYWKHNNIIQFAAFKNHIGLYPGSEAVENFKDELSDYQTSKGTIRVPIDRPIPTKLVSNIARWCRDQI